MGFFAKALGGTAAVAVLVGLVVIVGAYFSKGIEPAEIKPIASKVEVDVAEKKPEASVEAVQDIQEFEDDAVASVESNDAEWPEISWDEYSSTLEERAELWNFERDIFEFSAKGKNARILPHTLNVLLAETVDYRLDSIDIQDLPEEIAFAVWPDSKLTVVDRDFYLINPPTNIMELYYVQAVVEDDYDFYYDAMQRAQGLYVRDDVKLLSDQPIGRLFVKSMAEQGKAVIVEPTDISEDTQSNIREGKLEFTKIDIVLPTEGMEASWNEVIKNSQHGEEITVLVEARGSSVEDFKKLLVDLKAQQPIDDVAQ